VAAPPPEIATATTKFSRNRHRRHHSSISTADYIVISTATFFG
jgi:hypothetical protein